MKPDEDYEPEPKDEPDEPKRELYTGASEFPRRHAYGCEAERDHRHDCATATALLRLHSFAQTVLDEFECTLERHMLEGEKLPADHVDDCWHCAARQALEPMKE
jgi:hypothetical protein